MTGRIPLTVIGGFLGSGKTTLLNRLLARRDGRRLAVLVNDFGALNIDAALVAAQGAGLVALSNGCVCCQIGGDLTDALIRVIDATPKPDAIVIEASGVSDPWRIAQAGLADPALALDAVVVMADAEALRSLADDPLLADTVQRQLDAADLLVLNHCDRIDAVELPALRAWLDARCPVTPRFETTFGDVPAVLLGALAEMPDAAPTPGDRPLPREHVDAAVGDPPLRREPGDPAVRDRPRRREHPEQAVGPFHGTRHDERFASRSWSLPGTHRADALRSLLRDMPAGTLRLKGVLRTDVHGWAVLQFAGRHGSLRPWPNDAAPPDAAAPNTFAAIGLRGQLPGAALETALRASLS